MAIDQGRGGTSGHDLTAEVATAIGQRRGCTSGHDLTAEVAMAIGQRRDGHGLLAVALAPMERS